MNFRRWWPVAAAALGGAAQTLSWPSPGWWPLAFVCLTPLALAVRGRTASRGFLLGWVYGLALSLTSLPWLAGVLAGYGGLGLGLGWGVIVAFGAFLALFQGVFGWLISGMSGWRAQCLAGAVAWAGLDWLKNWVLTGFNWTPLAGPLILCPPLAQALDVVGVYGLGFFVALVNLSLAAAVAGKRPRRLLPAVAVAAALLAYGQWQYPRWERAAQAAPMATVAVVQPSTEQMEKWDAAYRDALFAQYEKLNAKANEAQPWFILWPETAMPFFWEYDYGETEWLRGLSQESAAPIVTGVAALDGPPGFQTPRNRLVALDGGDLLAYYDKRHLVPFGEYLPLDWLPFLKWAFFQGFIGAAGNFGPGAERPLMELPRPGDGPPAKLGAMICFESIFPDMGRALALAGADVLIVPTNDGWFGRSRAPAQHLLHSCLRAVETRRPLARAANTGISALIYPSGRVMAATKLYEVGAYPLPVPLMAGDYAPRTAFVRAGWLLGPLLAALTILLLGKKALTSPRKRA